MEWWVLELMTVAVMIAVVAVLGPLIKRFGKAYAADVFRANPRTGKSYLVPDGLVAGDRRAEHRVRGDHDVRLGGRRRGG